MKAKLQRWWWLAELTGIAAAAFVFIMMLGPEGEYVSTATYIVRPSSETNQEVIQASRGLADSSKVEATYVYVIESDAVIDRARARADTSNADDHPVTIDASVVPGADMLVISASSTDAELAYDMVIAVGEEAIRFVDEIDELYSLTLLDDPEAPTVPDRSGLGLVGPVLAASVGAVVAVLSALLADRYFGRDRRLKAGGSSWGDIGTNDAEYTKIRLLEEISRTDVSGVPFQLAVVRIGLPERSAEQAGDVVLKPPSGSVIDRVVKAIARTVRRQDHVGRCDRGATDQIAAILPDMSSHDVAQFRSSWESIARRMLRGSYRVTADVEILSCRYERGSFIGMPDAVRIAETLAQ